MHPAHINQRLHTLYTFQMSFVAIRDAGIEFYLRPLASYYKYYKRFGTK